MSGPGPGAPENTTADPLPAGQYKLIHNTNFFPPYGGPLVPVPAGTIITIKVSGVGQPVPEASIGTFGNTPNETQIIIFSDDANDFEYIGEPSENNVSGGRRKRKTRKQRKARKQKSNRRSRRARRRN